MIFVIDDDIRLGFVEQGLHSMRDTPKEQVDIAVMGSRKVMELELSCIVLGKDPVGQPAMEVRRKLQEAAIALAKGHRARKRSGDTKTPGPQALPGKDTAQEDRQHFAQQGLVISDTETNLVGQRQWTLET